MPSVSGAQHRFMALAAHDPAFAQAHHIRPSVAAEFMHADKGNPLARGTGHVRHHRPTGGTVPASSPEAGGLESYAGQLYGSTLGRGFDTAEGQRGLDDLDRALAKPMPGGVRPDARARANAMLGIDSAAPAPDATVHRDAGGFMPDPMSASGIAPTAQTMNPLVQNALQRYKSIPPEKLQEFAARLPPNSPQGAMARRVLQMKRMMPNTAMGSTPAPQGQAPQPSPQGQGIAPSAQATEDLAGYAMGGSMLGMPLGEADPWWARREASMSTGYLHGSTLGRADHITTTAPGGAYVVPADVIAGLGEGNSLAGARVMQEALATGPYGTRLTRAPHRSTIPRPPGRAALDRAEAQEYPQAKGGATKDKMAGVGHPVPVKLSHGEMVLSPRQVLAIGRRHFGRKISDKMAMKLAHAMLDRFVVQKRREIADKMKRLPPPATR